MPVVNRTDGVERCLDLNRGKPTGRPLRLPLLDLDHASSARARASKPVLNASLEHSAHHGATSALALFHSLRIE